MDFIKGSDNDQIRVSISLTKGELRLITNGLGRTTQNGRVDAGMSSAEASVVAELYWVLGEACSYNGIKTDHE